MKRNILVIMAAAILAGACTEKFVPRPAPDLPDAGCCVFTAEIVSIPGTGTPYVWGADTSAAGIYSLSASNVRFIPRNACVGKSGRVEIYGESVAGEAYAYFPYTRGGVPSLSEGKLPVPAVQSYAASAAQQLRRNGIMASACTDGGFTLQYWCGVLCITVPADLDGEVEEVTLSASEDICGMLAIGGNSARTITGGASSVTVRGIGLPCSEAAPLQVRFMLPEGTYSGMSVELRTGSGRTALMVKGSVTVRSCMESTVMAQLPEERHDMGDSDFEEEIVDFDD